MADSKKIPIYHGLIAAPFSPMHENGDINYDVIDRYVDLLLERDVRNAFVNGTNGEGTSLTMSERKRIAEKWIEAGKGKLDNVIIHVGTACLRDSQELARHASTAGAGAIACLPPYFFRPSSVSLLVDYLAVVAKEAPNIPFLYYHFPDMSRVEVDLMKLMNEAVEKIPNFGGLKCTSYDVYNLGRCIDKFGDKLNFCYGRDEQFACAVMLGCKSGVGGTYNYAGKIYSRIMKAAASRDFKTAAAEQLNSQKMIGTMSDEGMDVALNKAVMEAITALPVGPPRLPLRAPPKEKVEKIMEKFKSMGILELLK